MKPKKITLRTPETELRYQEHLARLGGKTPDLYNNPLVWQDDNYVIVKNMFPCDGIASRSHLLLYKDWNRKSVNSMLSHADVLVNMLKYDLFFRGAEDVQSVPEIPHVHLINLHLKR